MGSRRRFLQDFAIASTGLALPLIGKTQVSTEVNTLPIPELYAGDVSQGKKQFQLQTQSGESQFFSDVTTPTYGINGNYLGPTLHLKRGEDVAIQVKNALAEDTTLHWHGLHVPAKADGGPSQLINPNGNWTANFNVNQKAGTFWYHSHVMGKTGEQVYRGLAGMIIIDDDESAAAQLPATYGVDDIPLIVQDRRFNEDGSLSYVGMHRDIMTGLFGDTILVNGARNALFTPTTRKVRFRLLNASNARTYSFAFDDGRSFHQISSDGGFLEQPLQSSVIELAASERAEIVVDVSDGTPVNLISKPLAADSPYQARGMMRNMHPMNNETLQILAIQPQSSLATAPELPIRLTNIQGIPESEATVRRQLTLSMVMGMGGMGRGRGRNRGGMSGMGGGNFFINDTAMDMNVINQTVKRDTTEIWEIFNDSMMMHPFHIHHGVFQILDRDGKRPDASEKGLKDTVKVGPGQTVRFIMRFNDFSDPVTPYMYHCHILEHEDNGMMGQFVVV